MNSFMKFCRDKAKLNLLIDIFLLLFLMLMAGIGFLIKYVLVSGDKRNLIYGQNVNLELWGMDRHQWGTIHLIVSIAFLVLIILHIIFHWTMIICLFRRLIPKKNMRIAFSVFLIITALFFISSPLFVVPDKVDYKNLYRQRVLKNAEVIRSRDADKSVNDIISNDRPEADSKLNTQKSSRSHTDVKDFESKKENVTEKYSVSGTQSLNNVASQYDVPCAFICNELNIPENMSYERLGRLRKKYGFKMSEVSKAISKYKQYK